MPEIVSRPIDEAARARLLAGGVDPRMARLFAARGVKDPAELAATLPGLVAPGRLGRASEAATLLADAIAAGTRILIVADYDADGATACAVGCARCGRWARVSTSWSPTASASATD